MSNNTSPSNPQAPIRHGVLLSDKLRRFTTHGIRAAAFWAAVLLPIAYVPVFYGYAGVGGTWSFLAVLVIHMACVVIGHDHNRPAAEASTDRHGADDHTPRNH